MFFFFLPLIETFPHSMRLCVTVAELKVPNTVEKKKYSFASPVGPLFPRSPAPLSYTAAIASPKVKCQYECEQYDF